VKYIETYNSNNMQSIKTFVFALWENQPKENGNWIKVFKESQKDLNGIKQIHWVDSVNVKIFKIFTDLTNDCYALIQGNIAGEFYQLNAFVFLTPFLKVKQIDLKFQNEDQDIIQALEVHPKIKEQVLETIKYNKELYDKYIWDFIKLTIYSDPFNLCKLSQSLTFLDHEDPEVYFNLEGFTKIKSLKFNSNRSLLLIYGYCKQDYYQRQFMKPNMGKRKQTQKWENWSKSLESSPCFLIMSTKFPNVIAFIQNVSPKFTHFCFSPSLDFYRFPAVDENEKNALNELEKVRADGSIIALDSEGNTEIIEINNEPLTRLKKLKEKQFRISKKNKHMNKPKTSMGRHNSQMNLTRRVFNKFNYNNLGEEKLKIKNKWSKARI